MSSVPSFEPETRDAKPETENKSRGEPKAGALRPYGVKEQGHLRLSTVTGASKIQVTPTAGK
jgi:hypothetical protein